MKKAFALAQASPALALGVFGKAKYNQINNGTGGHINRYPGC